MRSLSGIGCFAGVDRQPYSTASSSPLLSSMRPYPIIAIPGSIPSTRVGIVALSPLVFLYDLVGEIGVGEHVLHVVELLQLLQELERLKCTLLIKLYQVLRDLQKLS